MLQSLFVCRRLLTGGTVIPVSLIAVVPTVLEKSVFYGYLAVASVSLGLPTQFVHCCLVTTRAFMPASPIVVPYTILEISKFLGQLPVDDDDDDDDDDEKCPRFAQNYSTVATTSATPHVRESGRRDYVRP